MASQNAEEEEMPLLGGDFIQIQPYPTPTRTGTLFIEARIKDGLLQDPEFEVDEFVGFAELGKRLEAQLSQENLTFDMLEDIMANERNTSLKLGAAYENAKECLHSLKVVEYLGPKTEDPVYSSNSVKVRVHVFELYDTPRSLEESKSFPQGEIVPMPHVRFEGVWDELVFEDDIKGDLIWMMTNILRFSNLTPEHGRSDMNPLILLSGPPGTGKTSLSQGLAQKISIRLNSTYKYTQLVQIKTATLLSKYYSESAKQVDQIFTEIARMCQDNPAEFVCVLIDEVESIASSREFSTKDGESQDSLRATNALLTGLDRMKDYSNIMFLCTSNMLDALDSAFLDRCGLKISVDPPSIASQYEILKGRIHKLIRRGVIYSDEELPLYADAIFESNMEVVTPGAKLLVIVKLIRSANTESKSGSGVINSQISGRGLTQLPEQAVLRYLRDEVCDLNMALEFIERFVLSDQDRRKVGKEVVGCVLDRERHSDVNKGAEIRGQKRNLKVILEEDCNIEVLETFIEELKSTYAGKTSPLRIED